MEVPTHPDIATATRESKFGLDVDSDRAMDVARAAAASDRVGAYSMGSASHTNAEPEPAAVMLRADGSVDVVQKRETCEDVLGADQVPSDIAR